VDPSNTENVVLRSRSLTDMETTPARLFALFHASNASAWQSRDTRPAGRLGRGSPCRSPTHDARMPRPQLSAT